MSDTGAGDTKRLHFLSGVEDHGAAYECKKCGHVAAFKVEMKEHRSGLVSPCLRTRLASKLRSLWAGN